MAGHSKWANIKHRKAAQDAKRGKVFTKLIRELVVAAKQGGPLPEDNPRLRAAVDKALSANMTKDTIARAIERGAGNGDNSDMEEVTYEGYAMHGVAVLVECLTDNKNRTVAEVRHAFSKMGGNLGTDGSVAYLFTRIGQLFVQASEADILDIALEAGAEDVLPADDDTLEIHTPWEDFMAVKQALADAKFEPEGEVTMLPSTTVTLDEEQTAKVLQLIDMLEELDDVQSVYSNADFNEAALAQLN